MSVLYYVNLEIPVLPTKRATRGRKRAKRVKWKSSKGIEK
jgi:hypothetical protein